MLERQVERGENRAKIKATTKVEVNKYCSKPCIQLNDGRVMYYVNLRNTFVSQTLKLERSKDLLRDNVATYRAFQREAPARNVGHDTELQRNPSTSKRHEEKQLEPRYPSTLYRFTSEAILSAESSATGATKFPSIVLRW